MQRVELLLLLFLYGVQGQAVENNPDLLFLVTKLQTQVQALQTQVQALQTQVQALQTQDQAGQTRVQSQTPVPVAFYASWNNSVQTTTDNWRPFIYSDVKLNIGNGYNPETRIFTAPVRGLYVFHVSGRACDVLVRNSPNTPLVRPFDSFSARKASHVTSVAMTTLEANETVFMVVPLYGYYSLFSPTSNTFSGFLLAPM